MCSGLFRKVKSSRKVSVAEIDAHRDFSLPFQDQRSALEARHAGHDLPARAVLFLRQPVVVVQERAVAGDDVGLALAADAAAAEIGRIDAGRLDRLEQALLLADADLLAADGERHVEGQAGLRRGEMLEMHGLVGQPSAAARSRTQSIMPAGPQI